MTYEQIDNLTFDQVFFELCGDEEPVDRAADRRIEIFDTVCEQCQWTPMLLAAQPVDVLSGVIHRIAGVVVDRASLPAFVQHYLISQNA